MAMSREDAEILANVNEDLLGFGEPGEKTKQFVAEGYLEIELVEDGKYWRPRLTKAGKRIARTP